ncbi:MAG: CBS domain-containing protein [Defluviicoccus sp.]|nr:MAG: CBS domain-containing protein [Defluviicoccus sp.]
MHVGKIAVKTVYTMPPGATVSETAQRMRQQDLRFMPVVEGDRLIGVITDRDIVLRCVAEGTDPDTVVVQDVMSREIVCCFMGESIEHARTMMNEHRVRRLPVIDKHNRLVGLVALADLEGGISPHKKGMKVVFHKEVTDSRGQPHKVAVKTVYITGQNNREQAQAAAVRRLEAETGSAWTNVATGVEAEEETSS